MNQYPIYQLHGSAYERGRQHGELARDRVERSVEIYRGVFVDTSKVTWSEARERAKGFAEAIRDYSPSALSEMQGIADGSRHSIEDIVAINCRTEIMFGVRRGESTEPASECTTIAVTPNASADGRTILGKNWDWRADCMESVVILQNDPTDAPRYVLLVEAGMVGRDGFNEHGIAITGNLLKSIHDRAKPAMPVPLLRRQALTSRRLDDAINAIWRADRAASTNYVIAHESGIVIDLEASPKDCYAVYPERGLLTHSNHFVHIAAQVQSINKDVSGDSLYRIQRARDLLEPKIGQITIDDVKAALRDHTGHPFSICRHPDERQPKIKHGASIASIVFDLTAKEAHIASGPPCCHDYRVIRLPDPTRATDDIARAAD